MKRFYLPLALVLLFAPAACSDLSSWLFGSKSSSTKHDHCAQKKSCPVIAENNCCADPNCGGVCR